MSITATILLRIGVKAKKWVNFVLDRVIDVSDMLLLKAECSSGAVRSGLQGIARFFGDFAYLLHSLPRLTAYQLKGSEWNIIFVGSSQGCLEVSDVLFAGQEAAIQEIGRFVVWELPAQSALWLEAGIHLVVCELSRICPWQPTGRWSFVVPTWVAQVLKIPEAPEALLVGRRIHGPRRRIKQAQQNGFDYRFTRSLQELACYYHEMYLPFIRARHGNKALVASYEDLRRGWFNKGGLILVTQHGRPVAGSLWIRTGDMCHGTEEGILHNDANLVKQGMNAFLVWSTLLWSYHQGAKYLHLGGSHAWCENGPFEFKALWRAQVTRRKKIYGNWTFLSQDLPVSLHQRLNQIGFLCEFEGKFYRICLADEGCPTSATDLDDKATMAQQHGLAGVAILGPGQMRVYSVSLGDLE